MSANASIRPATVEDVEQLADLSDGLDQHVLASNSRLWKIAVDWRERWEGYLADADKLTIVAEVGTELVGYVLVCVDTLESRTPQRTALIAQAYVDRSHRGRGIARRLMRGALDVIDRCKADDITLRYVVGNREAEDFWAQLGFETVIHIANATPDKLRQRLAIEVRPVQSTDAEQIVALLNPIIEAGTYTAMSDPVTVGEQRSFIDSSPLYFAAHDEDRIVGIQDVELSSGEISTFVALGEHRRGIGQLLTRTTIRAARELECRQLHATIRADNPGAIAFYERQGFRVAERDEHRVVATLVVI